MHIINKYFIESAFPTEQLMNDVIEVISSSSGLKKYQIESRINMKPKKIEACLKYLLVNGNIYVDDKKYYKTPRIWKPDLEKCKEITNIRRNEMLQMEKFSETDTCYMEFIAKVLDDSTHCKCGKCTNCRKEEIVSSKILKETVIRAQRFLKEGFNIIEPRKRWPIGVKVNEKNTISGELQCEIGRVLSNYGDAGWGKLVTIGKYTENHFDDQLVDASCLLLKDFIVSNDIKWVTNVPSLRRKILVKNLAERVAMKLGLQYEEVIDKIKDVRCQKELHNSYMQFENAYNSFEVREKTPSGNVLLIDDMVDSKWTFTVCGYKLINSGSGKVFPFALANSAGRNGDD